VKKEPDTTQNTAQDSGLGPHLFKKILESSGVAMAIRGVDFCPIFANNAFLEFYGYSMEEILRSPREEILPPETMELYLDVILPSMQRDESWEGEYVIRSKRGRLYSVWARFDPIFDRHNELTHIISIMRDASASRRLRNALTQTELHLKFFSENTSDCLFRIRLKDGKYDYISSAVENITGYEPQKFNETPRFFETLASSDCRNLFKQWWEEFNTGCVRSTYEVPIVHKNGSIRWITQRISLVKDDDGAPLAVEGIISDITDAKMAENALKANEEKYRFLAENSTDVIWRMDNDFTFTYATPSVTTLLGYTVDELVNIGYPQLMSEEGMLAMEHAHHDRREAEKRGDYEHVNRLVAELYHKDGHRIWSETVVKGLYDENFNLVGYQGVSRDISERQEHEESLRQGEARFRALFEDSPISLWEEDLTRLKAYFDELKSQGVDDFRKFFYDNPDKLGHCATLVDVVAVNKATLDLLRAKSTEDLLGNLDKVLTESSMAAFTEEMILLASGGYEYCGEITHRTLEGDIIWVMVHFLVPPEYQDSLSRVIVSLIDVTPRKRAEQALVESEERYRVVVENAQEGVVVVQDNEPVFINDAVGVILGYSMEELKGLTPFDLIHPNDALIARDLFDGFVSSGTGEAFGSLRIITAHDEVRWVTISVKSIMWGGKTAHMEIVSDISSHKRLEEELRLAHRDMEGRVQKRTAELSDANLQLTQEINERQNAQRHNLSLTQQLLRIQEDERQRIARDLHDKVAQDLSSIVLNIETLFDGVSQVDPIVYQRCEAVASIVRNSVAAVRDIAYGLRPPALDQLGLTMALERHCEEVSSRSGVDIDFSAVGIEKIKLDFDTEINVYRMVQESLTNMSKHAGADRASVRLVGSHPDLLIRVNDNGQGFDVDERVAQSVDERRMGLKSMEERARLVGGSMEIQSRVGSGTRIIFKVPITTARRR